jgi:hypothetical protein
VRLVAADGYDVVGGTPFDVQLHVSEGGFSRSQTTLGEKSSTAKVEYRSARLGVVELTAAAGALKSQPVRLQLTFPWLEFLVVGMGGLVGALLRRYKPDSPAKQRSIRSLAIEGGLSALVVYGIVLVLPIPAGIAAWVVATPLGAFVIGAAGGFLGSTVIEPLVRRLIPIRQAAAPTS